MTADEAIIAKLDELISVTRASAVPIDKRWLLASEVAVILGYDTRTFQEKIACRTDFPKAMRIDGIGHPRWKGIEVEAWAENMRKLPRIPRRKTADAS